MPKVMSATEVKVRLGTMVDWAVQHGDEIIIESRGLPKAVIMSYTEFEKVQRLREEARRRQALERLETLAQQVAARNQDLSLEDADDLADRFGREVIEGMAEQGKIRYQGQ